VSNRRNIARRLTATLATAALAATLALAWNLRPNLPPLPRSLTAPLATNAITTTLELAAWAVFILLDLALLTRTVGVAIRRAPTHRALRLRSAFATQPQTPTPQPPDWRAHSAPLARPILRLPRQHQPAPEIDSESPERPLSTAASPPAAPASASRADDHIAVNLLGPLELTGTKKKQPRRQATKELIAYLAIQQRPVSRDQLLEALWPGDDPRRSAARFYQAASEARKLLGDAFQRNGDMYNLGQVRVDIDEVSELRARAATTNGDAERALLEQALRLFRGEPLAGIDSLWAGNEQRRLTALRIDLLVRVGQLRLESGDAPGSLELAEQAAGLDGSNERPVQLAMEADAALGRRDAVADRYRRVSAELDERFGLKPSGETTLLYRRLLSQSPGEEDELSDRAGVS
jgi:DNA-binding SARP family transcriptional activator